MLFIQPIFFNRSIPRLRMFLKNFPPPLRDIINNLTSFQWSTLEHTYTTLCEYIILNNAGHKEWLPYRPWEPGDIGSSDIVLITSVRFFQFKSLVGALLENEGKNRHPNPENQPQY